MKTKEELSALRKDFEALSAKLAELSEEELAVVSGGVGPKFKVLAGGPDDTDDSRFESPRIE